MLLSNIFILIIATAKVQTRKEMQEEEILQISLCELYSNNFLLYLHLYCSQKPDMGYVGGYYFIEKRLLTLFLGFQELRNFLNQCQE